MEVSEFRFEFDFNISRECCQRPSCFNEVWNQRSGDKFYLRVEEFNCCDCYRDCYTVAMVVDEETVGHVLRNVPKLANYDEFRSRLYKFSFNKLMEADNYFLAKNYLF